MSDVIWRVPSDSWPTFDIDRSEFEASLAQLGEYWPGAMESLAQTVVTEVGKEVQA